MFLSHLHLLSDFKISSYFSYNRSSKVLCIKSRYNKELHNFDDSIYLYQLDKQTNINTRYQPNIEYLPVH